MGAPKQYTDAQIAEYMAHVRESAGAKYTPDQLKEYEQHVRDSVGPEANGFKPDKPAEADIFGDDANRIYAGFGDPKGIEDSKLLAGGYGNVRRNASGELVAQGPDGKWYKDQSSLFKHPENWLESAIGGAPATAGMMIGGATAGIPGAAAGSALGEAARGGLGHLGGVYSGKDRASDILNEGVGGAVAETGGKIIGKVTKPILDPIKSIASDMWSSLASKLSGVDKEDVLRTILNRGKVFKPKGTQEIAKSMADELGARQTSESAAHRAATDAFNSSEAGKLVSTEPVLSASQMELERSAPSMTGEGTMSPEDYRSLSGRSRQNLMSPQVQATATSPTIPEKPEKTLGDLLQYKKGLSSDVNRYYDQPGLIGDRTPRNVSFMESEAGRVADLIHQHSPAMAAADARLSDYANQSKLLKPVMNEGSQQGFLDTLINSGKKDNARDAAEALVPTSYSDALDLGANRAWTRPGDKGFLGIPKRAATQAALTTIGAEAAHETHNPWLAVPGAIAAAAISPRGHREFIRSGIPLMKQVPAALAKPVIKRFSPFNPDEEK